MNWKYLTHKVFFDNLILYNSRLNFTLNLRFLFFQQRRKKRQYYNHFVLLVVLLYNTYNIRNPRLFDKPVEINGNVRNTMIWDCTLYNGESYMLMTRLWRLSPFVNHTVILITNNTYTGRRRDVSFAPFEKEIKEYVDKGKLTIFYDRISCEEWHLWGHNWCRDENARLVLFNHWKTLNPQYGDYVLMSDLDEIPTRSGFRYMLDHPPLDYYSPYGINTNPNFMFEGDDCYTNTFLQYTEYTHQFMWYRNVDRRRKFPDFPIATHCSYCFKDYEPYLKKLQATSHVELSGYPFINKSYLFRIHYCRIDLQRYLQMNASTTFRNDTELVPPDPRFDYLRDPNFHLNIKETIYKESDLSTLCDESNDWWIDFNKRILKPKWRTDDWLIKKIHPQVPGDDNMHFKNPGFPLNDEPMTLPPPRKRPHFTRHNSK